jgi:hypothetical protein
MKPALKIQRKKINLLINILLGLWISAVLCLQIILYPPLPFLYVLEVNDYSEQFTDLHERIKSFFITTDINLDFSEKF